MKIASDTLSDLNKFTGEYLRALSVFESAGFLEENLLVDNDHVVIAGDLTLTEEDKAELVSLGWVDQEDGWYLYV